MRAIIKESAAPGLTLKEVPTPRLQPGHVLINVKRVGLCGTDLHIYHWEPWARGRIKPPLIIGHEFSGVVAEVGPDVAQLRPGDRVTAEGHIACGLCYQCKVGQDHICRKVEIIGVDIHGAFADFIAMPAGNVWKLDPEISLDVGSLHDPLGNAFHAVMSCDVRGKRVLVMGCGPIGTFCVSIARACGASLVMASEISEPRTELARKMGAHLVVNPEREDLEEAISQETGGEGADVVLEMSGSPKAIRQAFRAVHVGGEVALLGLPNDEVPIDLSQDVIFKGLTIRGIVGRRMYETWHQMRSFLLAGLVDPTPVITHRFRIDQVEEAMKAIATGAGKVVFNLEEGAG